jgi:hypothetical protein
MAKTLGFYGIDTSNPLIRDIIETFGEQLQNLTATDNIWLLYRLCDDVFTSLDQEDSPEANDARDRLNELSEGELIGLIQCLGFNTGKPLGFWGLSYDTPLVIDLAEAWGEALENVSEHDRYWLIARCSAHLWMKYHEQAPSAEAEEVFDRASDELAPGDLKGFIQALVDD